MPKKTESQKLVEGAYEIDWLDGKRTLFFTIDAMFTMERNLEKAGFVRSISALIGKKYQDVSIEAIAIAYHAGFLHEGKIETINDVAEQLYRIVQNTNQKSHQDLVWLSLQVISAIDKPTQQMFKDGVEASKKFVDLLTGGWIAKETKAHLKKQQKKSTSK